MDKLFKRYGKKCIKTISYARIQYLYYKRKLNYLNIIYLNFRKQVNTVRVGDRYLLTKEDDDIAQQLHIQHFISHPNYTSKYKYNDIAMIKTVEEILFHSFVVPSCIDDLDSPRIGGL